MNSEKLANWLQIVANLGILAGLIMVAVQINQNTASVKGSAYQAWVAANVELNMSFAGVEAISQGDLDSASLTDESQAAFAMWNMSLMQMVQATDYLYRTGTLDKNLRDKEVHRAAGHLEYPGVRQWWDAGGKTQLTPEFVELIESTASNITRWTWEKGKGFVSETGSN